MIQKRVVLSLLILILVFSFVSAEGEVCTSDSGCASGEVCSSGTCSAYCTFGEAECSNGIDDDGDGTIDYAGACYTDTDGDGVLDSSEEASLSACAYDIIDNDCGECISRFTDQDFACRSPLDTDESSDPSCATSADDDGDGDGGMFPDDPDCSGPEDAESGSLSYVAEEEKGFFGRLWDWLIFWN